MKKKPRRPPAVYVEQVVIWVGPDLKKAVEETAKREEFSSVSDWGRDLFRQVTKAAK